MSEDVWHGTPHKFDRFDITHVGSGEGNQTYGWGLYFTDKREIADWYRTQLSKWNKNSIVVNGKVYTLNLNDEELYFDVAHFIRDHTDETKVDIPQDAIMYYLKDIADKIRFQVLMRPEESLQAWAQQYIKRVGYRDRLAIGPHEPLFPEDVPSVTAMMETALRFFQDIRHVEKGGAVMKVKIPDGPYMLWDYTLKDQPAVAKALRAVGKDLYDLRPHLRQDPLVEMWITGKMFSPARKASALYAQLTEIMQSQKDASLLLKKHGIIGIKYLDGVSRAGDTDAAYNYVLFTDDVHIQHKE